MRAKRGEASTGIDWFIAMVITALAFIFLMLIVTSYTNRAVAHDGVEAEAVFASIYYNQGLFSEQFGVIEFNRFTQEEINQQLQYEEKISANITLKELDGTVIDSVFINPDLYNQLKPFIRSGVEGEGSGVKRTATYPVIVVNNEEKNAARLHIEVFVQ